MSLNNDTIQLATDKKYSEFSNAVKTEMMSKMANHDISKNYVSQYDKIQNMKNLFAKINSEE